MFRAIIFQIFLLSLSNTIYSSVVRGRIIDSSSKEELVGAKILIKELQIGTISGLDGTYLIKNIPAGNYTIVCSFIGYQTIGTKISVKETETKPIDFNLLPLTTELSQVTITAKKDLNTDISARSSERLSNQVISVVSAKTIELSPDLTVANVIQRVSGVTLERNSTGDGQYALLRGMDKRFNYTMVNGVKIPSPDNKNRFVPLDIFPSELLDRLEVTKSLNANMEGDGVGGAVNMVMKDAPASMQATANMSTGYNSLFFHDDDQTFEVSSVHLESPNEKYGLAYPVQMKDFTSRNLRLSHGKSPPNFNGGFSLGNRFLNERIGILLAGSYQNNIRGNSSDLYSNSIDPNQQQTITHRFFSNHQARLGIHAKLDFKISPNNKLVWYNAFMDFTNVQVREAVSLTSRTIRFRLNRQSIFASTFKGLHTFNDSGLNLDWSLSYGKALNETPDNVQINELIINGIASVDQNSGATRRWEHNSDKDLAGYANIQKRFNLSDGVTLDLSSGGLYRTKIRGSYFNEYSFKPFDETKLNPRELIRGVDYNNYDEIKFSVSSYGNLSDPLNYDASEKIGAFYLMEKLSTENLQFIAGVRAEYTNQGYNLKFPTEGARNEGNQEYVDILPSFNFKLNLHENTNLRVAYSKALNRPSFFEIVPYSIIYEEYKERGNPDLKHTIAHNFDIRYEYFPTPSDQFMAGLFYKNIKNPIEFGMLNGFGQDVFYMPTNYGTANNYGLELDIIKYFSWFGIKANYTYTNSNITTTKMRVLPNPDANAETNIITEYINQTRPLYGQAAHVANISFLFKEKDKGWDGQLAFSYTGNRLCIVSRYLNDDSWQAGYISMDASIEKKFIKGFAFFAKASNLLNSPMIQYVKLNESNAMLTDVATYHSGIVERKEFYGLNFSIGIKFKFN